MTFRPDKNELKADMDLVSDTDVLVKRLLAWRNNIVAHRNPKETLAPNSIVVAPLEYSEIEDLLKRAIRIINKYSVLFKELAYSTSMVGADDYKYVLDCVRKDLTLKKRKFEEEMAKATGESEPVRAESNQNAREGR